jgi:hypothetical protein
MTPFQREWRETALRLGLSVSTPYTVSLNGIELTIPVLLRDFGAEHGMLLVTDFGLIRAHADDLVAAGYGFSCLSEPRGPRDPDNEEAEEALIAMLRDWSWSGTGPPPDWLGDAMA